MGLKVLFRGLTGEVVRALVVESAKAAVLWIAAAVVALVVTIPAALSSVSGNPMLIAGLGVGVAGLLLVPPTVGFGRSRTRQRVRELQEQVDGLKVERDELEAQADQDARVDRVLADWLAGSLMDPYRLRKADPDRNFDTWLNDTVFRVLSVVFRNQGVTGLAIIRQHESSYSITHRSAGVPDAILGLDPAPVYRPLEDCLRIHAPNARAFSFHSDEELTWVAFFPEQPFALGMQGSRLESVAAMVAHVYTVMTIS